MKNRPQNILNQNTAYYKEIYKQIDQKLLDLLDTPVIRTYHIGSTAVESAYTSGIIDILVFVNRLHEITTLDEKRLNLLGFYRLHHPYKKKCVFAQFDNLKTLNERIRLHVVEQNSKKSRDYLDGHALIAKNTIPYNQFKQNLNESLTLKQYEDEKSSWFRKSLSV
ncbi:GrpB family protein [Macrococcus armenti]|uniref:GrpB family protein n=1 Tax=Macrococcus armenti TaxID=2875764 RepID=A0ABY3ZYJ7_9STAP|nr:GrpB family protein [Macrococcus armenti]UOB21029.1 GrpB family protein [Macrococcus armenti]